MLNPSLKDLNPSLQELKEIAKLLAKKRGIKGYKSMTEDRLLSALKASESVRRSELNFDDIESRRNEDYDADGILRTTKADPIKTKKQKQ